MYINQKRLESCRDGDALLAFFVAQRTGSSAMSRWLQRFIPADKFYFFRNVQNFRHWRELEAEALDGFRGYSGFSDFVPKEMPRPLAAFSLVRHPLYRIASLYEMSKRDEHHVYHDLAVRSSFEDYYLEGSKDRPYYFQNLCTRRIADQPNAEKAIEMIENHFCLVGTTGQLPMITAVLVGLLDLDIAPLKDIQSDEEKYQAYLNSPLAERIFSENASDIEVFEYVSRQDIGLNTNASIKPVKATIDVMGTDEPVIEKVNEEVMVNTTPKATELGTCITCGALRGDLPTTAPCPECADVSLPCPICGVMMEGLKAGENCPSCKTPSRGRSLEMLLRQVVGPYVAAMKLGDKPLLGFAATGAEKGLLGKYFPKIKSASLYGRYGTDHEEGVDVRDLSRYEDNSFSGVFGILLFDYFPEYDQALAEISRVLEPGGIMFTLILTTRVLPDKSPPIVTKVIKSRPGYFEYVPDDNPLLNVKVGQDWFLSAIARAGLEPGQIRIYDQAGHETLEWLLGYKSRAGQSPQIGSSPAKQPATVAKVHTANDNLQRYSMKVDPAFGFSSIDIELDIPEMPKAGINSSFGEHVKGTDTVITVKTGAAFVSNDLGNSWQHIELPDARDVPFVHCFTTSTGHHLLQSNQASSPDKADGGQVFCYDENWKLVSTFKDGHSPWHGSCSIDEADGTIMWAEYPDNAVVYQGEEKASKLALTPRVFRSRDGGLTWQMVFELSWREIRHFHTILADPFVPRRWWLSSGDRPSECRVWVSNDDGDSWVDATAPSIDFAIYPGFQKSAQSIHRYTDIWIGENHMIWGADDWLGGPEAVDDRTVPDIQRAGARMFYSKISAPLDPKPAAWIGNPVRSMTDIGDALIITTEAKSKVLSRPQVYLASKTDPELVAPLFDIEVHRDTGTGFTYSRASRVAKDGVFFSFRGARDFAKVSTRLLRWKVDIS